MTQNEIIAMARQAGGMDFTSMLVEKSTAWIGTGTPEFLERFAKLVAQHEREACAKMAEKFLTSGRSPLGQSVANAIRAREQA